MTGQGFFDENGAVTNQVLGEVQRDLTAEQAAVRLRDLSDVHYRQRG